MNTIISADGTKIAFDQVGAGSPVIMIVGAFNTRSTTAPLADALQERFMVFNYDRRGRGDSADTPPYTVEREIEDLDALITEAGGSAAVFGYSSGANLALKAAAQGLAITKLALYEPAFVVDDEHPRPPVDLADELAALIAAGKRGDAVELFQTKAIGMPDEIVAQMRNAPFRPALEGIAHTLVYEATIVGDLTLPTDLLSSIETPTLVVDGDKSMPAIRNAAAALAHVLSNGQLHTLPDQGHDIDPGATATAVEAFLQS